MDIEDHIAAIKAHLKAIENNGFYYGLRQLEKKIERYAQGAIRGSFNPAPRDDFRDLQKQLHIDLADIITVNEE